MGSMSRGTRLQELSALGRSARCSAPLSEFFKLELALGSSPFEKQIADFFELLCSSYRG